jgi:hypothetical protein
VKAANAARAALSVGVLKTTKNCESLWLMLHHTLNYNNANIVKVQLHTCENALNCLPRRHIYTHGLSQLLAK